MEKTVDEASEGGVRSEIGHKVLFDRHDDGLACVPSCGTHFGDFDWGQWGEPSTFKGDKTVRMARPPLDSGGARLGTEGVLKALCRA